jgi:hypothetical protein
MVAPDAGPCPISGQNPCSRIQALKEATLQLVDNVAALPNSQINHSIAGVPWSSNIYNQFNYQTDYPDVKNKFVTYLTAGGSTCLYCGLRKAQDFLPDSPQTKRVVVLMTDGYANQMPVPAIPYPSGYPPGWPSGVGLSAPFRSSIWACYEMKQAYPNDLTLWTISFGNWNLQGSIIEQVLQYCASSPAHYVHAPNGQALAAVFAQVLTGISDLRLTR